MYLKMFLLPTITPNIIFISEIQCDPPSVPKNGVIKKIIKFLKEILEMIKIWILIKNKFDVGDVVFYDCEDGYTLKGSEKTECLPNNKWSNKTPTCKRKNS